MVREKAVKMLKGECSSSYEYRAINEAGETRWIMETVASIQYKGERASLGSYMDITERKQMEETIRQMAYHDVLTGLPNRRLFDDRLTMALARAHRNQQKLAMMSLDLDQFKSVNDMLGHAVGDQLLKAVGQRLTSLLRKGDTVARIGGDEFALLLPEIARVDDTAKITRRILEAFRVPFVLDGREVHITTSIGIAIYPEDGEDADALMNNADTAMYSGRELGLNNYQRYNPTMIAKSLKS